MKRFCYSLVFVFFSFFTIAQTDTEFWFAAPEVSAHNANFDRPIVLRITAYNQASTVTISQPANVGFVPITVNVPANSTSSVDLTNWIDQIENKPPNTILNYGLLITATHPVTVYYEVVSQQCLCNPEIFSLKGRNALGRNFFIPSQNFVNNNNGYSPQPYSSFDIVATENNTQVTITPSNNIVGRPAGVPFSITLNRGQTYSATATSQLATQHLMGSTVSSDKPIAITIKDDLMSGAIFGGCADLGGDQLVPIEYIGTKYAVVRGFLNAPYDKVFVLATQNGTTVSVDGTLVTTLNTGQTYMIDMPNAARFIETSLPAYVLQLSGFGCELGISLLPPIECTGSSSVAITRSTTEPLFLNLIVRTGGQNNFLFNGAAGVINGASFAPVPGSGGLYQYAQVTISTGQLAAGAAAIVSNTTDFFHLGIIHGTATGGTRFGYFSNFNRIEVVADKFSVPVCQGYPIQLNANSPFTSATYTWTGPNGFSSNQKNPLISNAQPSNAGNYIVVATVSGCSSEPDTVAVQVTQCGQTISGIINVYTPVTSIDVCTNSITVGNSSGFNVGDRVLLIQMKGAQINTTNTAAFGDVTNYDNAGNYEFGNILSIQGNQIALVNTIQRSYTVSASGLVQLVRVPQYSGNVHAIHAPVTCQPWNGSTGGIVAFEATGTVTLSSDINATNRGFRAGVANDNSPYTCNQQDYFYPSNSPFGGRKGEGIFELPTNIINGRGKNANGGGGGNDTNSGGGGGGNYGAGGRGGNQWTGCPNLPIGGEGGLSLTYSNSLNKIFLGGGAGGGHQNDATATPGTNGGGIIIIKCNSIVANGGNILSFANNSIQASTDGSGGAGAGGTVLLHTNTIAGNLTIDVHGGRGGDNNTHGTGGGGGGGVVWSNIALPSNVTLNLSGGQPGFHTSTNSNHGAAPGGNGGVITGLSLPESSVPFSPLPKPLAVAPTQVCEGESIQFSVNAIPNVSYSWIGPNGFTSTQQNPIIANASTLASGDYIVIVQNSLGCVQRDTVTVSVRPKYLQTVNVNICQGASYTRPNGVSVSNPGTYRDTLQAVGGCDSIIVTHLTVTSFSLQTGNDTSICIGRSVQMAATGGSYYRWRPATALSDTTIANPIATPTQTTQYIVTAYEPSQNLIINGDFESGNTGFTTDYVYSSPNPLQPPGHYTVGTFVSNYWWSGCTDHTTGSGNMLLVDGADGSNGVPIGANVWCQSVNVLPNRDYVFSTWLTNLNTTGSTSQLRLLINGIPIGPVQNTPLAPCQWNQFYVLWNSANHTTANICITETSGAQPGNDFALDDISFALLCYQTDTVTISVNPPDTTVVNREICSGSNYVLPNGNSVNTAGSYTTTLLNSKGCDSVIITHLTINPVFRDTIVASICQGKSYTLPNGNITTATGTYNSLLQTAKGCDSLVTTILNVLPNSLTIVDTIICPNTNFTRPSGVVVNVPGTYSDTLIAANGCDSVITTHLRLHPVYAQTITDTICIGNTYTLPDGNIVSQSGTYLISLATVNGCDSLFTVNLSVLNVLGTATTTEAKCFGGSDGSIAVNATGGVSPYNFSINTGAVQTGISSTTFSNLMAGSYDIEIADANGCTAQVTATVNEPTQLILSASSADATCFGAADGKVQLQATGGKIPYQYSLNNTSNDNGMFNKLSAGNYTATVRDVNNCTATYSFIISEPDEILITATPNPLVLKLGAKDSIRLSSNYSNINYNWSPSQGLDCNYCNTVTVSPLTHTTYRVKGNVLINGSYCEAETYVDVIVEADYSTYVPNTFSPNNDGINDFFEWYGNKQAVKLIEVQIFNRWGEKVFESNDVNFRWDGTYLGSDAPVGIYIYLLKITWLDGFTDNRYKGSLMLVR